MMTTNKESHSGIQYKGVIWFNTYDNPEKWLKSIYDNEKEVILVKTEYNSIVTKLIVDGKRV